MTDDKRKKKRGRSKIFRSCFRFFAADDEGPSSSVKSDGGDNKNGRLGEPVLIAVSGGKGKDFLREVNLVNDGVDCFAKRSPSHRRIVRVLKAVLFDPKMVKKIRRTSSKSSVASDTSLSSSSSEKMAKTSNDGNACGRECSDMDDSSSRRSNLLSSSSRTTSSVNSTSSSSSINSSSRSSSDQKASSRIDIFDFRHPVSSNSKKPNPINSSSRSWLDQKVSSQTEPLHLRRQGSSKSQPLTKPAPIKSIARSSSYQKGLFRAESLDSRFLVSSHSIPSTKFSPENIKFGGNNWNLRLCLFLLLSLVVMMIWGRIFSILCTSISFYFVPCRQIIPVDSVTNAVESLDIDSQQYKKRVIMAGLLERNRR